MNGTKICSLVKFIKDGITVEILLTAPNPDYAKKMQKLSGHLTTEARAILDFTKEEQ